MKNSNTLQVLTNVHHIHAYMPDVLITKTGKVVECLSGGTHEQTCLIKLHRTLQQFIKDNGVRVNCRTERIAIECNNHLTIKQVCKVNSILRNNEIYAMYACIRGREQVKNSFRPIRGLPAELR